MKRFALLICLICFKMGAQISEKSSDPVYIYIDKSESAGNISVQYNPDIKKKFIILTDSFNRFVTISNVDDKVETIKREDFSAKVKNLITIAAIEKIGLKEIFIEKFHLNTDSRILYLVTKVAGNYSLQKVRLGMTSFSHEM